MDNTISFFSKNNRIQIFNPDICLSQIRRHSFEISLAKCLIEYKQFKFIRNKHAEKIRIMIIKKHPLSIFSMTYTPSLNNLIIENNLFLINKTFLRAIPYDDCIKIFQDNPHFISHFPYELTLSTIKKLIKLNKEVIYYLDITDIQSWDYLIDNGYALKVHRITIKMFLRLIVRRPLVLFLILAYIYVAYNVFIKMNII